MLEQQIKNTLLGYGAYYSEAKETRKATIKVYHSKFDFLLMILVKLGI